MNDPYGSVTWPDGTGHDLPDRIWTHDDFTPVGEFPAAELTAGFTSGAFIKAALRRRAWFWCATAVVGLLIGCGLYVKFPSAYHATATVLLTNNPNEDPLTAMQTDATIVQSHPVAERVVRQLGLPQSVDSFMAASTASVVTDQVLTITVGAPSANAAVTRVNALATAFLQFRAAYVETQQRELAAELNQQVNQAQEHLNSINGQISQVSAQPISNDQQKRLQSLQKQGTDASNALGQIEQNAVGTLATSETTTDSMVRDSQELGSAVLAKHSRSKSMALDVAGGFVGGIALGMGIVVIGALVSDRLRRRDEIAEALGTPVRLSVGTLRTPRWLPVPPRRAAKRDLDMKRVVAHLHNFMPGSSRGPASLAIVAVDDAQVAAQALATLAVSYAREGKQVVAADLSGRTDLARLLGASNPGMHSVSRDGTHLLLAVPEPDDVAPVGPLQGNISPTVPGQADEALVIACDSADVLLTLATLDPAFGSEYLATWTTDVAVMVTAGRSSEERIRGVREMIRHAGTRLESVVLVEADKSDQSLGVNSMPDESIVFGPV